MDAPSRYVRREPFVASADEGASTYTNGSEPLRQDIVHASTSAGVTTQDGAAGSSNGMQADTDIEAAASPTAARAYLREQFGVWPPDEEVANAMFVRTRAFVVAEDGRPSALKPSQRLMGSIGHFIAEQHAAAAAERPWVDTLGRGSEARLGARRTSDVSSREADAARDAASAASDVSVRGPTRLEQEAMTLAATDALPSHLTSRLYTCDPSDPGSFADGANVPFVPDGLRPRVSPDQLLDYAFLQPSGASPPSRSRESEGAGGAPDTGRVSPARRLSIGRGTPASAAAYTAQRGSQPVSLLAGASVVPIDAAPLPFVALPAPPLDSVEAEQPRSAPASPTSRPASRTRPSKAASSLAIDSPLFADVMEGLTDNKAVERLREAQASAKWHPARSWYEATRPDGYTHRGPPIAVERYLAPDVAAVVAATQLTTWTHAAREVPTLQSPQRAAEETAHSEAVRFSISSSEKPSAATFRRSSVLERVERLLAQPTAVPVEAGQTSLETDGGHGTIPQLLRSISDGAALRVQVSVPAPGASSLSNPEDEHGAAMAAADALLREYQVIRTAGASAASASSGQAAAISPLPLQRDLVARAVDAVEEDGRDAMLRAASDLLQAAAEHGVQLQTRDMDHFVARLSDLATTIPGQEPRRAAVQVLSKRGGPAAGYLSRVDSASPILHRMAAQAQEHPAQLATVEEALASDARRDVLSPQRFSTASAARDAYPVPPSVELANATAGVSLKRSAVPQYVRDRIQQQMK